MPQSNIFLKPKAAPAAPVVRLFWEQFTADEAAPIATPHTAAPGPGQIVAVQNDGQFSISGGKLNVPAQASPAIGDLKINLRPSEITDAWARKIGRALAGKFTKTSGSDWYPGFGFYITPNVTSDSHRVDAFYVSGANVRCYESGRQINIDAPISANKENAYVVVQRSYGAFYLVKGGDFAAWTLIAAPFGVLNTDPLYAQMHSWDMLGLFDDAQVFDLATPWDTDFGIAAYYSAAPASGDGGVGAADGIAFLQWTPAANEVLDFMVRRTDDNNCWIMRCDQAAGKVYLFQKQTGTETERGATGGVAQTFTVGTKYNLMVCMRTQAIHTFVDNVEKIGYTTASFNQTATGVKASGFATAVNLACFAQALSWAASTELDRFFSVTASGQLVIFDGDSLTSGQGASAGHDYPTLCKALLSPGANDSFHNSGVAGQDLNQINGHMYTDVDPRFSSQYSKVVLVLWGGTNDPRGGKTEPQLETWMTTVITHAKLKFSKLVVLTMLPRQDAGNPGDFETTRATFNAWLAAQASVQGFTVADVAANANLQDPTNATYFNADKVHLTDAGYAIVAGIVAAAVSAA